MDILGVGDKSNRMTKVILRLRAPIMMEMVVPTALIALNTMIKVIRRLRPMTQMLTVSLTELPPQSTIQMATWSS